MDGVLFLVCFATPFCFLRWSSSFLFPLLTLACKRPQVIAFPALQVSLGYDVASLLLLCPLHLQMPVGNQATRPQRRMLPDNRSLLHRALRPVTNNKLPAV